MDKLTTNDIQQFYAKLKQGGRLLRSELYGEGLSDQTVRGIHTTLHAALDKAVAEKLLFRNPADGCRLPSAKAREMQVLAPEKIQRLLIQAKEITVSSFSCWNSPQACDEVRSAPSNGRTSTSALENSG